jgi:GAF domain-containing protein
VTTTILAARTVHGTGAPEPLSDLRERRLELRAEQVRSRYLRRLLQARLDLAVAATVGAHVEERSTGWSTSTLPEPPSADEVSDLLSHPAHDDLGRHLGALRDALGRMSTYEDALERECEASTDRLVAALSRVPRARLGA